MSNTFQTFTIPTNAKVLAGYVPALKYPGPPDPINPDWAGKVVVAVEAHRKALAEIARLNKVVEAADRMRADGDYIGHCSCSRCRMVRDAYDAARKEIP